MAATHHNMAASSRQSAIAAHARALTRLHDDARPDWQRLARPHAAAILRAYARARGWQRTAHEFSLHGLASGRRDAPLSQGVIRLCEQQFFKTWRLVDHCDYFTRAGWPVAIASHPYDVPTEPNARAEAVEWGAAHGLRVAFPTDFPSWYHPEHTTLVEITRSM